jgi:hypothetical protein
MPVRIIASFTVLMQKASALGKAKQSGNSEEILLAQKDHDEYLELCRNSGELRV